MSADPSSPEQAPALPVTPRADDIAAFRARIFAATPHVWLVWVILGTCVLLFALMVASGADFLSPGSDTLIAWGGNYGARTLRGEPWRLVTSAFLHIGFVHLAFNMYVLATIGPLIERIFGRVRFLTVYVTAALSGSLVSLLFHRQVVAVGASGAIFGLYGALAGFLQRQRGVMPLALVNRLAKMAFGFIAYNLLFGFAVPGIDNAAHVGGLLGGAAAGLLLAEPLTPTRSVGRDLTRCAIVLCGAIALTVAEMNVIPAPADFIGELDIFRKAETGLLADYNGLVEKGQKGQIDDDTFANRLETTIIPRWHDERERLVRQGTWPPAQEKLRGLLVRYVETRELAFAELARAMRAHDADAAKAAQAIELQAQEVAGSIKHWKPE